DGIRGLPVTGVETSGLPVSATSVGIPGSPGVPGLAGSGVDGTGSMGPPGCVGSEGSNGGVPVTAATFSTTPASFSACVTAYVAVPVVLSPGASAVVPSTIGPVIFGSDTAMSVIVTLPVFVTVNVYVTVLPTEDRVPV